MNNLNELEDKIFTLEQALYQQNTPEPSISLIEKLTFIEKQLIASDFKPQISFLQKS